MIPPMLAAAQQPMACHTAAFTPADRARQQALLLLFRRSVRGTQRAEDSVSAEVDLDAMPLRDLGEWIGLERRCCPFLAFDLRIEAGARRAFMRFGGGPGARAAAESELLGR